MFDIVSILFLQTLFELTFRQEELMKLIFKLTFTDYQDDEEKRE